MPLSECHHFQGPYPFFLPVFPTNHLLKKGDNNNTTSELPLVPALKHDGI